MPFTPPPFRENSIRGVLDDTVAQRNIRRLVGEYSSDAVHESHRRKHKER